MRLVNLKHVSMELGCAMRANPFRSSYSRDNVCFDGDLRFVQDIEKDEGEKNKSETLAFRNKFVLFEKNTR